MKSVMGIFYRLAWTALLLALFFGGQAAAAQAQSDKAYALVDTVNQLRAANGLYAYQINAALMGSAQTHSEYQAALGNWTHTGAGGTDETQRAVAAGYGSAGAVRCDENVAYGIDLTPSAAVYQMWADATHTAVMLSNIFVDVKTGAYTDSQGRTFYTLDVCYVSGSVRPTSPPAATAAPSNGAQQQPTNQPSGFQTATPQADGSIVHVVLAGESLYLIADRYGVTVNQILTLNNLNVNTVLRPGTSLIIWLAPTLTPTQDDTPMATRAQTEPTPTRRPTRTATSAPTRTPLPTPTVSPTPEPGFAVNTGDALLGATVTLAVLGTVLVLVGMVLLRRGTVDSGQ